jgi:multiple sugar transport system ATP-binding protein
MASLELNHIYKVYQGGVKAVNDMTMKINDKEFIVFVGPSGCGKSTTLRMIAGLEEISAGELKIGDQIVNDMPPKERNIAMVFQNYALYPHMTVYNNIAYGLRISHTPKDVIDKKVHEAAKILGIEEYLDRKPKALSGGQRQRVALGRAIVRNPKVFLLDEPLSNLDAKLRGDMRAEISKLHQRLATTFIYVTHDQTEAMTMGTRIVVMKNGFVQQIDTPRNVYNYPANKFVAGFIGTPQMNFFDGTMLKKDDKVNFTLDNGLVIPVPYKLIDRIPVSYMDGVHRITLGVRPDNIVLHEKWMDADEFAYLAKVSAHFDIVEVLGGETILYGNLKTDNPSATSEQTAVRVKTTKDVDIHSNEDAELAIDLRKIHVFDAETEKTLIEKIPSFSTLPINVAKDKATIVKEKFALAPALVSQLEEGAAEMRIPSDAVILGAGEINATVVSSEIVGEKKLFALNVDGHLVFAVSSPSISLEGKIKIDFDQTKLSFKGHKEVKALNVTDILKGNLYKSKEYQDLPL